MRRRLSHFLAFALLAGWSAPVAAQTRHIAPFTGTWKMNRAKSKFNPGPPFRSFTLTFTADGTRHLDLTGADGQPFQAALPWSDGQEVEVKITEGNMSKVTASSKIRGRSFRDTWKENGKVIEKVHGAVSRGGKTLTVLVDGPGGQGSTFHNRVVFEKQ